MAQLESATKKTKKRRVFKDARWEGMLHLWRTEVLTDSWLLLLHKQNSIETQSLPSTVQCVLYTEVCRYLIMVK